MFTKKDKNKCSELFNDKVQFGDVILKFQKKTIFCKLEQALATAKEIKKDLVQISTTKQNKSVCLLVDKEKFLYEQKKKLQKQNFFSSRNVAKNVKISTTISDYDLVRKVKQIKKFVDNQKKVKIILKYQSFNFNFFEIKRRIKDMFDKNYLISDFGSASRSITVVKKKMNLL